MHLAYHVLALFLELQLAYPLAHIPISFLAFYLAYLLAFFLSCILTLFCDSIRLGVRMYRARVCPASAGTRCRRKGFNEKTKEKRKDWKNRKGTRVDNQLWKKKEHFVSHDGSTA